MITIIIAFFTALLVSLSVHYLTIIQVEKWFDEFFDEETQKMEKFTKELSEIIQKGKSGRNSDLKQ
ncbi:hypothetical protein CHBNIII7_15420 [Haemophilus influenzae]|nr:hypothetical protein CHBNIII7_15420 [Haemophilus influenzae]